MTDTTTQATPPSGDERDVLVDVRGVKVHFPIKRGVIFDKVVGHVYAVDGVGPPDPPRRDLRPRR